MPFVHAGPLAAFPPGRGRRLLLEGSDVTLWNAGGTVYAMESACPHQHIPALHQGTLDGTLLTCPMHGWTFSLVTGKAQNGSGRLRLHNVEVRGGELYVELPDVW